MRSIVIGVVAIAICLLPTIASAQTSYATMGGVVTDESGAVIPGVAITATNTLTGIVTQTVSNDTGTYHFPSLQSGTYSVSAQLPGFQTYVYKDVPIGVSAQVGLNFKLSVATVTTVIEVTVAADALLATTSTVGQVITEQKVAELPLGARNALNLVQTTAGAVGNSIAGGTALSVNVTRDGVSVTDGRYNNGVYSATYTSPDLVDEVRVLVAPVDAETGRGSAQVQMTTRSGTNAFHGSAFIANYNSKLAANSWSDNFRGIKATFINRNQFGARLAGPIIKNKTFFFVLYEGQLSVSRAPTTASVLTAQARQGIFRYFFGKQNGNALSNAPSVDLQGNPVAGDLRSFSVLGLDPNRPGLDPTGFVQKLLARMPLPNDFTTGDGLNTAGYTWIRRTSGQDNTSGTGTNNNRNQLNIRLDHNFNAIHKVSLTYSREHDWSDSYQAAWPGGYDGEIIRDPRIATIVMTSALRSNLLNEFRFGFRKGKTIANMAWDDFDTGKQVRELLPKVNGVMYIPRTSLFASHTISDTDSTFGSSNPLYSWSENISWNRGQHAFKGGVELRLATSNGFNSDEVIPRVTFGAGGLPVQGINSTSAPGLTGSSTSTAQTLLTDLSGSIGSIIQVFNIAHPDNLAWQSGLLKERFIHQNEATIFFKDDWKVVPNLTLNLGVRWEWYGVPWESRGLNARPIGGTPSVFGISGTGFADMYQPGRLNGKLTQMEFVGKASTQPGKQLYNDDWNNFGPAVGFSWSIPYFGKSKTVLRAGYGINYSRVIRSQEIDTVIGLLPGAGQRETLNPTTYMDLSKVTLPLTPTIPQAMAVVPLTDRTQSVTVYGTDLRTPYTQNWNVSLERQLIRNLTLTVSYVASKGTKLTANSAINDVNIFENQFLDAFKLTQAGNNAPLFDQMLKGLNLGSGVINGTTITGSASLRSNSATRSYLANSDVGQLANYLNNTNAFSGVNGGILRNGGLPENFFVANPQFNSVSLVGNSANSTYNSMQTQLSKRFSSGYSIQGTYTWSRTLGAGSIRNQRNFALDKSLQGSHRTHDFRANGTWELPFGPGRKFAQKGVLARLLERWQFGAIMGINSGSPLSITASTASFNGTTTNAPVVVGDLPKGVGKVTEVANGIVYFDGLTQVTDPGKANVTTSQSLANNYSNWAIADASGKLLLINPVPGQIGNYSRATLEGPGSITLDMNLLKRVSMGEGRSIELRIDAINILNHPNFGSPTTDINSTSFGRITSASGNRQIILNARVSF